MEKAFNPKLNKHHSGAFLRDGKTIYTFRTGYHMDKEMDKLLNPLSEDELISLLKSWTSFKKNVINNPKLVLNINSDDIKINNMRKVS